MPGDETVDVAAVVSSASLAELSWLAPDGAPRARGVVPLLHDGRPAVAFLYADEDVARQVAASRVVTLSLTEQRSTASDFVAVHLRGAPLLLEDPTGAVYLDQLVLQELRRYPPSRLFADSPLLMREHWWYLPRLVVGIEVDAVRRSAPRAGKRDHLLAVATGGGDLQVAVAGIAEDGGASLLLDTEAPPPSPGEAALLGQDASFPDLEQWAQWRWAGHWDGSRFQVEDRPSSTGLGRPPGLLARWRRQRALARRCAARIPAREA